MNHAGLGWTLLLGFRVHGRLPRRGEASEQALTRAFAARLWQQSTVEDRLQHIRVRPQAGNDPHECRWDVGILLMADSDENARAVGARLCNGALDASPETAGWALQSLF